MNESLDRLCEVFEDELERQENVLRLCLLQEEAVMQRDAALLAMRTEALNLVLDETSRAEDARIEAARRAVEELGLAREQQTMTGVVAMAPEPWRARLADCQQRLRLVMVEAATVVRRNHRMIRRLMKNTGETLSKLSGAGEECPGYTGNGRHATQNQGGATLLNQAG